jgi:transcription antitermination factor NusB
LRLETLARELALKALYQHDLVEDRTQEDLRAFCLEYGDGKAAGLAMELLSGCLEHREAVDSVIRETAQNWELERMATTDRNILRLGVFELLFHQQTPPKVAINEAIELAKKYSTENSPTFVNGVLDRIFNTRVVSAEAPAEPALALKPDPEAKADLHVHSTASDGSFDPAELPALAAKAGLSAFALTDHDSVEGIAAARKGARKAGVELVPGVELTGYTQGRDGREVEIHIAGLFVDETSEPLRNRLRELREARVARARLIVAKLREIGLDVDEQAVMARAQGGSVGRVHVAQQMVEQGFCRDLREAFERYIGAGCPAYVPKEQLTPAEAVALARSAGGCAVLCHPGLLLGVEEHLPGLVESGLDGIEVHYPMHSDRDEKALLDMAREYGLAVTGGSDFHGAAKPDIHIGQEFVSFVELCDLQRRAVRKG